MASSNPPKTGADGLMWRTPKGASPRGSRSDPFISRSAPPPAVPAPQREEQEEAPATEPRDWAFGVPDTAPREARGTFIDPDANHRNQSAIRVPAEQPIPGVVRERFSENWERLASGPQPEQRDRSRRRLEKSKLSGWLFTGGRLEVNAAAGAIMLVLLLVAAFIYGRRLLTNTEQKPAPPAKAETR